MSIRIVRQHDSMQCGIACLSMVCGHFGKEYSLEFLTRFCTATSDGASLLGISQAAGELGLESLCLRLSVDDMIGHGVMPCILHWNQNHFVVLYKISKDGTSFYVADPAKGRIRYSRDEFRKHWESVESEGQFKGVAIFFEPTAKFGMVTDNSHSNGSVKFIMGYLLRYRRYFIHILLGLLVGCVLQLILPFLTQAIVDVGIRHRDVGFIWLILLGELMIIIGRTATDFIRRWLLLHISMRVNMTLVSDFFVKLLKLPMSFFDTKLMGDLLQRINDHSRVQSFLTSQVLGVIFTFLSFIIFGIVLLIYNRLIFLIFVGCSILYGVWMTIFLKKREMLDYELFDCQADNHNKTYQFVTTMQEIKLQNCERRRRWEWEDSQAALFEVQLKSLKLQQTQEAGSIFLNEIRNIVITVLAATSVIRGEMTLGGMLAVQYIIGQLNSPVDQLMSFIYSLQDVKISLRRINELHQGKKEESDAESVCHFPASEERSIVFDRVDFKYDPHAPKNTLTDVTIDIPTGKVTAIVGASGSGKTTIVKLMLGYYPVTKGDIRIAGRNIRDYNLKWWRSNCGVVMQDGVIFSESIARNIAVSDDEIDIEKLHEAARVACIHDYIMSLPLSYDTRIGRDGTGLSQGQKQRILIARAVYKNPEYIFLDEATNALDAKNERMIVENLCEFYRGKPVVVVAHRLSTVKNADRIVVIDDGKVVETGNHATLIEKRGNYFNLVRNQLELGS